MANMSSYLEEKILDHVLRNIEYTPPSTVYVGIVSDSATDSELEAGTLTNEITGYTGDRKSVSFTAISQNGDGEAETENTALIEFESMPACTIAYAIVCDAATGGNILFWGAATESKTSNSGDTHQVPAGNITIDLD